VNSAGGVWYVLPPILFLPLLPAYTTSAFTCCRRVYSFILLVLQHTACLLLILRLYTAKQADHPVFHLHS